jgi:ATP/maltotriose-dependent transcriptional regulator MalT
MRPADSTSLRNIAWQVMGGERGTLLSCCFVSDEGHETRTSWRTRAGLTQGRTRGGDQGVHRTVDARGPDGRLAGGCTARQRWPAGEPLSQRELDILGLIAQGCSNREAAVRLFISEATVKTHVLHIYAKLGVNDRAAAVATGFERGLLPRS